MLGWKKCSISGVGRSGRVWQKRRDSFSNLVPSTTRPPLRANESIYYAVLAFGATAISRDTPASPRDEDKTWRLRRDRPPLPVLTDRLGDSSSWPGQYQPLRPSPTSSRGISTMGFQIIMASPLRKGFAQKTLVSVGLRRDRSLRSPFVVLAPLREHSQIQCPDNRPNQ
jgi:hypothetical protein